MPGLVDFRKNELLFYGSKQASNYKTMEFTTNATAIKTFQYTSYGPSIVGEITFKSDCTEYKRCSSNGLWYGEITNIQTYCPQDVSKERNLVFPTKFIKLFKLLGSSESGRKFWFEECRHSNFDEAGIDTNDAEFGEISGGDSKSDLMRYIYRDMVVPFTELEKENKHLREQLKSKDQQLKTIQEELKRNHDKYLSELLKVSTLKFALEAKDEEIEEQLEAKDEEIEKMVEKLEEKEQEIEELNIKYHDYLLEFQEELGEKEQEIEEKEQELKDAKKEVMTRGLLLKSCVDDLKTCLEKAEEIEKKNQELEHLNHRLICECGRKSTSYFSPEM